MKTVATIGLDIAEQILQVHAVDKSGRPVLRRKLRRTGFSERASTSAQRAAKARGGQLRLALADQGWRGDVVDAEAAHTSSLS